MELVCSLRTSVKLIIGPWWWNVVEITQVWALIACLMMLFNYIGYIACGLPLCLL